MADTQAETQAGQAAQLEVRALTGADATAYRPVRLRALREEPESFGSAYEDAARRPVEMTAEQIETTARSGGVTLGAFVDGELVGMATMVRETGRKTRHIGHVVAVYVAPEVRGRGYGRALLEDLIARARQTEGLEQLHLGVIVTNEAARALYRALGFEVYGLERRVLKLDDGRYLDHELMALRLA